MTDNELKEELGFNNQECETYQTWKKQQQPWSLILAAWWTEWWKDIWVLCCVVGAIGVMCGFCYSITASAFSATSQEKPQEVVHHSVIIPPLCPNGEEYLRTFYSASSGMHWCLKHDPADPSCPSLIVYTFHRGAYECNVPDNRGSFACRNRPPQRRVFSCADLASKDERINNKEKN